MDYTFRYTEIVEDKEDNGKRVYDVYLHPKVGVYPHTDDSREHIKSFNTYEEALEYIRNAKYMVHSTDLDEKKWKTVKEILEYINDPDSHSDEWTDYDENDWEEGLLSEGFWEILAME